MATELHGGAPLFRRIAGTLADAIERGTYPVGGHLPPEFTLMRMFGASRFSVREALSELRARGLVASRRGAGSVVLRRSPAPPAFGETYSSLDEFLQNAIAAPLQVLDVRDVLADEAPADEDLGWEAGRHLLYFRGLRRPRDPPGAAPMAVIEAFLDGSYGALQPRLMALTGSVAEAVEETFGVRVQRVVQELQPVLLDAADAALLSAEAGGPALSIRRWYFLAGDGLLIASRSTYPRGRLVYRTELRRGPAPDPA